VPNPSADVLLEVELLVPVELVALVLALAAVASALFAAGVSEFKTVGNVKFAKTLCMIVPPLVR
jgi:hypothetical protein